MFIDHYILSINYGKILIWGLDPSCIVLKGISGIVIYCEGGNLIKFVIKVNSFSVRRIYLKFTVKFSMIFYVNYH